MRYGSGIVKPEIASKISHEIEDWHKSSGAASISIYRIEGQVFEKLIEKGEVLTAKAYEGYRKVREFQRETNTIDNAIYGIVNQTNKEATIHCKGSPTHRPTGSWKPVRPAR